MVVRGSPYISLHLPARPLSPSLGNDGAQQHSEVVFQGSTRMSRVMCVQTWPTHVSWKPPVNTRLCSLYGCVHHVVAKWVRTLLL
jgi:hypothetical protein